jgi:hypothetical protein
LKKIFRFLNVDDRFYSQKFFKIKHKSTVKRRKGGIGMFLKWLSETDPAKIIPVDIRRSMGRVLYLPFSTGIEKPILNNNLKDKLIDYLKDDTNQLRDYTGLDLEYWSV